MRKALGVLLCASMVLGHSSLAFAETVTAPGEHEVTVEGEVISTFEVILPTSITLQPGETSTDSDITVTSNTKIGNEEILSVIPEEVIYLSKNGTDELVMANVYQDKTKFMGTETGVEDITTTCIIETGRLSSGSYSGTLKFNIALTGDNAIIVDGEVRTWNWLVYNDYFTISEDGVLSKGTADLSQLEGTLNISSKVKTIDTKAFEGSNISTIVLGPSVETINDAAFMSADSLTAIEVDRDNKLFSSVDGVLFSEDGTKLIAYPAGNTATDYKIASNVTEIGNYAFAYCTNIDSLTIPSTVTKTGQGAFTDMSVVTSKYEITKDRDNVTSSSSNINSDTGSILLAKKVNGYTTWVGDCLQPQTKYKDRKTSTDVYIDDNSIRKIVRSAGNSGIRAFYLADSVSYITTLDGSSCNVYSYEAIPTYSDIECTSLVSQVKYCMYDTTVNKYNLYNVENVSSNDCNINCTDILYSEVDVYDANNNLIYKADITK